MDPVLLLRRAVHHTGAIVDAIDPAQLGAPTPCAGWTARDVVNHMVQGLTFSAAALEDGALSRAGGDGPDLLGDDPAGAYRAAGDAAVAAFARPGSLEKVCATPAGELPGTVWINFPTFDVYTHGWDLTRATGVDAPFPDEITAPILGFALDAFPPPDRRADVLGAPQDVPDGAPLIDQLVAFLGRPPDWKA
jgi:uncharacterized protein (TIGR03086 family)